MPVTGSIKASLNFTETFVADLATGTVPMSLIPSLTFTSGTAANQVNVLWADTRTLAATTEDLDLAGVLAATFGGTVTLARVKGLYVRNTHATATLTIGGAASNAFLTPFGDATDKLKVAPGGFVLLAAPLAAGYAVTAATGDILKVDAGASTIVYDIALVGCNA